MKIYRHRHQGQTGPPLTIQHPSGESTKAKHGFGATLTRVQKIAETGEDGQVWTIMEYDTPVATVTRTVVGVHTRSNP